jgi:hypothetical protein
MTYGVLMAQLRIGTSCEQEVGPDSRTEPPIVVQRQPFQQHRPQTLPRIGVRRKLVDARRHAPVHDVASMDEKSVLILEVVRDPTGRAARSGSHRTQSQPVEPVRPDDLPDRPGQLLSALIVVHLPGHSTPRFPHRPSRSITHVT